MPGYPIRPTVQIARRPARCQWEQEAKRPRADKTPAPPQAPIDPIYDEGTTLAYKGRSIRVLPVDGVPWFGLPDLADSLGLSLEEADKLVHSPDFPAHARLGCLESPEPDPEITTDPGPVTILSPVGVWWLTALMDDGGGSGQGLAAWSKREAARMCPAPTPGNPAVFLTLARDGMLPPYPWKYSGRRAEWIDLRWSNAGILARQWTPTTPKETCQ